MVHWHTRTMNKIHVCRLHIKSSGPKSSKASSYLPVSTLHNSVSVRQPCYSRGAELGDRLSAPKNWLRRLRCALLLTTRLVTLLLLLLVRERGQARRGLAVVDVAQGRGESANVMLDEGGEERLVYDTLVR
jgi:hypothetical protein